MCLFMYEKKCYTDEEFISMKLSKIARILELNHYKNAFLFFIKHPIKFIKRLSMFMKLSIGWTVISTVFGFVVFGLVTRELVLEKSINKNLMLEVSQVKEELSNIKSKPSEDKEKLEAVIIQIGDMYETIYSSKGSDKNKIKYKKRLSSVLHYLSNQNITLAENELKKLSSDISKDF